MLEIQFYARIILIALFGILFIVTMFKSGKKNPKDDILSKRIPQKILSCFFLIISLISLVMGIIGIANIQFPEVMTEQPISANMIVRSPGTRQIWGYPSMFQNQALIMITGVFTCLALAAYFATYRKSNSKWWQKTFKVIGIFLMWIFYVSATDFHYFDSYEFVAPTAFVILAVIFLSRKDSNVVSNSSLIAHETQPIPSDSDNSKYMPHESPNESGNSIIIDTTDVEL